MFAKRIGFVLLGISSIVYFSGCTRAKAGNVKQDLRSWVNNLLTPSKTTLEKAVTGYSLKGTLKNKPNNLMILFEMQPEQLVIIDSVRSDAAGNFELKGNVKEPLICMLQWNSDAIIYMILDNNTQAKLDITDHSNYGVEGKGIEGITDVKEVLDLIANYENSFNNIKNQAANIPNTPEGAVMASRLETDYQKLVNEKALAMRNLALSKKKSLIPYFIITYNLVPDPDIDFLKHALDAAKAYNSNSKYTQELSKRYENEKVLAIGAVAPDIRLPQPNGDTLALSSLRGKVVLIDFWASWCGPCRRENPFNTAMYKRLHPRGFEIYGISLDDDKNRWKGAIQSDSLNWYHVSDLKKWNSSAAKLYKVSGIPATYLLDKQGRIVAKGLRGEALQAKLEEMLANP